MADIKTNEEDGSKGVSPELVLDLNLVPDWAKKPPGHSVHETQRRRRDSRPMNRRSRNGDRSRPSHAGRRPQRRPLSGGRNGREPRRERPPRERANVVVRFLPEQSNLATIVKKISTSNRAYPLVNIANLFLTNEGACNVKIEPGPDAEKGSLYQCKACRSVFTKPEELSLHLKAHHVEDYFDTEEEIGDAPNGQFVCVAKCGLSGTLLGPPNHHSYSQKLQEIYGSRFSHMSLEKYKERIEMVRDEETIDQWKEDSRKRTLYKLKQPDGKQAEAMDRSAAEAYFVERIASSLMNRTHRAVLPLGAARSLDDTSLSNAVADAWLKEKRFPMSLLFSLRSAFRHMHLHVFKAGSGKGMNFVSTRKPTPMDAEHVVDDIASILKQLKENPGCSRRELAEALCPGTERESEAVNHLLSRLSWLIEKGHVIEFFDGKLSIPLPGGRRVSHSSRD
ncbi:MAG: hypothetical protein QGI24_01520 [Kiritimatiellia bacterium]|nr:hypothetical protein [Kiritimatiellia bacterium]